MHHQLPNGLKIRHSTPSDHHKIISVLQDWWGGRDLTRMLPKLFLIHFCNTSFIIEKEDVLLAFLIGFFSPSRKNEGYIHFAGVHPDFRDRGLGKCLYDYFFGLCKENGRSIIKACTSPVNKGSVEFHKKIGFEILAGDAVIDGIPVTLDYNRPDDPKVLFQIEI